MAPSPKRRRFGVGAAFATLIAALAFCAPASAIDPIFAFSPQPDPGTPGLPPPPPTPPPNGYFNGPCGIAVDPSGDFYVSDHYHDVVDSYEPIPAAAPTQAVYQGQLAGVAGPSGPCGLAIDSSGDLYVNSYHQGVFKYPPAPGFGDPTTIDSSHATGVAVDPATDNAYVNHRTHVSVYDSSGAPVAPTQFGSADLGDGYGVAVSGYGPTAGFVYVPDAANDTIKVYDPADVDPATADQVIDGSATPNGRFVSLRDSTIAVNHASGDVYVIDNLQPTGTEQPQAVVYVFDSTGAYLGHLKHNVVHGAPTGLSVDNTGGAGQGRVYVTSGNTHHGGVYAYAPDSETNAAFAPPLSGVPGPLIGGGLLDPSVSIGSPAPPQSSTEIACDGDACQILPPEPVDPTLTTLLHGLGNPRIRYRDATRNCRPIARRAGKLARLGKRIARRAKRAGDSGKAKQLRAQAAKLKQRSRRSHRAAKRCRRANKSGTSRASASFSSASVPRAGASAGSGGQGGTGGIEATGDAAPSASAVTRASSGDSTTSSTSGAATTQGFLPGSAGFDVAVLADGGGAATLAGSHPYQIDFTVGIGGGEVLRDLQIDLPAGLLANPAAVAACSPGAFTTNRSSPFAPSQSGEDCSDRSQVGTVDVPDGSGMRRFGLFNLVPRQGVAAQLGASPFGSPLVFDVHFRLDSNGDYALTLEADDIPQSLDADELRVSLWGTPGNASHNGERGDCLNEAEPLFPWAKCSIGEPLQRPPLAYLTLPTACSATLPFSARANSWQDPSLATAQAVNRDSGGSPVPITGCDALGFDPHPQGLLSSKNASTSTGFTFRLTNTDPGLANPASRILSQVKRATAKLPDGVTLNPSLGAGLGVCTPAQFAAESAFNPQSAGCPNASRIGDFRFGTPFYNGILDGAIYLAKPRENPFGSLLAVYLVAKSADRGLLLRVAGNLTRDPGDGTITAIFDGLPQLPYTDLQVRFRTGQRAPLITPPRCGPAITRIVLQPWAGGAADKVTNIGTEIEAGIGGGPCPSGTPPFAPEAVTGGVNANVGSYTPYYIRLSRKDTEQGITSYSLILPKGVTGKLAGIPFCPDAAIEAARTRLGADETANPSCPGASQVGHTDTGYGVGSALTYAPGRVYLAGPHGGQPLSLVTINSATVGPFDLGTIVIRSAFAVDQRTAQLQIDSSASDPIPHIIDGVPLHLRDIRIYMDRFQFTHNPSSCEASALISTLTGSGADLSNPADDTTATVSRHFQLLNCLNLGFRPRLGLRLRGSARRGGYPSLRANFVSRGPRDSNLKRIEVEMPHSLFLAQNHIRTVCTREQFAAERCPVGSVYGTAVAHTLLFDEPLRGNVYLRSSTNKLPDLVADLRSGAIRIVVEGQIGPGKHGGILTFFDNLPDAPIDRFTMTLGGGRHGLLQNSANICANPPLATVSALGQNNAGARFSSTLRGQCKKKGRKAKRGGQRR